MRFGNRFTGHDRKSPRATGRRGGFSVWACSCRTRHGRPSVLFCRTGRSPVCRQPRKPARGPGCRRSDGEGPPRTGNLFTHPGWPILRARDGVVELMLTVRSPSAASTISPSSRSTWRTYGQWFADRLRAGAATGIRLQIQVLTIDVGQCGLRHRGAEGKPWWIQRPYLQAIDDQGMRPARRRWRFRFLRSADA